MQASNLWAGWDYAFVVDRPKKILPLNAKKGKLIRIFKQKERFSGSNMTTFAVLLLEDGREVNVRARDVVDTWDEYCNERDAVIAEQEQKRLVEKLKREEEEVKKYELRKAFHEILTAGGLDIPFENVLYSYSLIGIPTSVLEKHGARSPVH